MSVIVLGGHPYMMCKLTKEAKSVLPSALHVSSKFGVQWQATCHLDKQLHAVARSTPGSWWKLWQY